jgi:predicted phage terminase large subunit-like protein
VSGEVWYRAGARYYLVHRVHDRMDFPTFIQAIRDMSKSWPMARTKLIEDKANGTAAEAVLRNELPGIVLVTPLGGKVSRAHAASAYYQAGNVYYPENAPWVEEVIAEHVGFPTAAHDDDVDAGSQAILYWEGNDGNDLARALQKLSSEKTGVKSGRVVA